MTRTFALVAFQHYHAYNGGGQVGYPGLIRLRVSVNGEPEARLEEAATFGWLDNGGPDHSLEFALADPSDNFTVQVDGAVQAFFPRAWVTFTQRGLTGCEVSWLEVGESLELPVTVHHYQVNGNSYPVKTKVAIVRRS